MIGNKIFYNNNMLNETIRVQLKLELPVSLELSLATNRGMSRAKHEPLEQLLQLLG